MTPKILAWDIETSYIIGMFFRLFEERINHDNILQDSFVICGSWQWLDQKKIHSVSVLDDTKRFKKDYSDDYHVIKTIHEAISQADAILAHNGNKFDFRVFNGRCLYHGLDPVKPVTQIDTLKIARKHFKLTSNRLDYIGKLLGVGGKISTPPGLWRGCTLGDPDSIKKMVRYNRGDITLLVNVYYKLLPYFSANVNYNIYKDSKCLCPKCGSMNIKKEGTKKTKTNSMQQFKCKDCRSWFSKPFAKNSVAR